MREAGAQYRVAKNKLANIAAQGTPYASLGDLLNGPTALATSADPVAAAKVIVEFAKTTDKIEILGGAMGDTVLDVEGVKALATLPSREELLSKLLGTMQAPVAKFVQTLNEVPTKFVRALAAVRDQKGAGSAPEAPAEAATEAV